jgi:hypothetical protein
LGGSQIPDIAAISEIWRKVVTGRQPSSAFKRLVEQSFGERGAEAHIDRGCAAEKTRQWYDDYDALIITR